MLDSDASFFLVPEFQSSRGARRTLGAPLSELRFDTATGADLCMTLMPDPGTRGVAALADLTSTCANAVPSGKIDTDFLEDSAADDITTLADTQDETAADFFALYEDDSDLFAPEPDALTSDSADIRAVTPRRPMRFTFAREAVEHSRLILPIPNLFENVFADDSLDGPGIDPRLQRSRARALAQLAAHEAALLPEARNLWFDDGSDLAEPVGPAQITTDTDADTITMTETSASDGSDGHAPRRAVRHLSVTRRTPKPRLAQSDIHDPLQDHLHQVREALYTITPEDEAAALAAAEENSPRARILAAWAMMSLMFIQIIASLRLAMSDQTRPLRDAVFGNSLRLPARAVAITGLILAVAQTIPNNLM
jgi:hypothetical protein